MSKDGEKELSTDFTDYTDGRNHSAYDSAANDSVVFFRVLGVLRGCLPGRFAQKTTKRTKPTSAVGGAFQPREPQLNPAPQPRSQLLVGGSSTSRVLVAAFVFPVPPKAEDFNAEEKPKAQREPSVLCAFPPTFAPLRCSKPWKKAREIFQALEKSARNFPILGRHDMRRKLWMEDGGW
jgi:hypothetical protein